jgi:hypothetical protein
MQRKPIPWLVLLSALPFMVGLALVGARGHVSASAPHPAAQYAGQTPSPTPTCGLAWRLVNSPNPDPIHNSLWGVDALSLGYAWAVGNFFDTGSNRFESLITRWDGAQWSAVPSPNVGFGFNYLEDVAAISANDAWAAGYWFGTGPPQTLIQRWDGTQWAIVPSPNTSSSDNLLLGLAAVASNDVWAVGYYAEGTTYRTLILHWNGTEWTIVPSPNGAGASSYLQGVAAISANDVWAVGYTGNDGAWQTLAMHWDGTQWSVISTPNSGTEDDQLQAVTAVATNDVWAIGKSLASGVYRTLTMRWNGTQWSIVPSPNVDGGSSFLLDVDASDGSNVWAVGHSLQSEISPYRTLTMRWDGTQWGIVPSANFGTDNNTLAAVAVAQANDVWAVGNSMGDFFQTLIERYHDPCGPTVTPTPTATQPWTPVPTPTITPTPSPTPPPSPCERWSLVQSPSGPGHLGGWRLQCARQTARCRIAGCLE